MKHQGLRAIGADDVASIERFISDTVKSSGCKGAVIGLSGGLDSAVVTKLCADALGGDRIVNIFMPAASTPACDHGETESLSRLWGMRYEVIGIEAVMESFKEALGHGAATPLVRGNLAARCRMAILYDYARKHDLLVVGTSNRSESLMGYFTKFGDGACDMAPIVGLYKTQVRDIARIIGVPKKIIDKVPTAGFWEGQTDEGEMGITYKALDIVLDCITKGFSDAESAEAAGVTASKAAEVRAQIAKTAHKRNMPARPDKEFN